MTLADRLRLAMQKAGMNQRELADAVGVKPPSVNGWLSEKAKFLRGENLLKAAAALGVSDDWLATGAGDMHIRAPAGPSQSVQLDPDILAASIKLIRMTFEILEVEFNQEEDGEPTALAYAYLLKLKQTNVTADNVVEFSKYFRAKPQGAGDDAGAGSAGASHRKKGERRGSG